MTLYETIRLNLKSALKNKDNKVVSVLRLSLAAVKNKELEKRHRFSKTPLFSTKERDKIEKPEKLNELSRLNDNEVLEVLMREAKKRKESIGIFNSGGRHDLELKEREELDILEKYLPKQLSELEMNIEIDKILLKIDLEKTRDFGTIMGLVMAQLKGRVDGKLVGDFLKKKLVFLQNIS